MRKINLKRLEIFADMQKKICTVHDVREQLANLIYANAYGFVGMYSLIKYMNRKVK